MKTDNDGCEAADELRRMQRDAEQYSNEMAERIVLGSIVRHNRLLPEVLSSLAPDDFAFDVHRRIYECVQEAHGTRGSPVDLVVLAEALQRKGWFAEIKPSTLVQIWDAAPTGHNLEYYLGLVKDRSLARALVRALNEALHRCQHTRQPAAELLADAERALLALGGDKGERGPQRLREALRSWEEVFDVRCTSGEAGGIAPAIPGLGSVVPGFFPGNLIVLAARPGVGKTAAALAMARGAAEQGHNVYFVSLEMTNHELAERMVSAEARLDAQKLRLGRVVSEDILSLQEAIRLLEGLSVWLDDAPGQTAARVAARARRLKSRFGLGLLVVDYLGLVRANDPRRPRHEQVGEIAREMKALAADLGIPVLLLSQLNREPESRSDGRPRLSDLRDSGEIEQHANTVILLHCPDVTSNRLAFLVPKQRSGPTGEGEALFHREQLRFGPVVPPDNPGYSPFGN